MSDYPPVGAPTGQPEPPAPSDSDAPPWVGADETRVTVGPPTPPRPSSTTAEQLAAIDTQLENVFGLPSFREGQREIIETVLRGQSALAVMPTGSGKSLCYQLPATLVDGVTLVVSPLIALMKDQVDSLTTLGVAATFINSTLSPSERTQRASDMVSGQVRLVFVAPERFRNESFMAALEQVEVGLLAVDEAHCISEWGHDFRPDYRELGKVRRKLGTPPTLALTATATPKVRRDIAHQLGIGDADTFVSGFERRNLFFEVYKASGKHDKLARTHALLEHMGGSAVVYCTTRKVVMEVYDALAEAGTTVEMYHGGMDDQSRSRVQNAFMAGEVPVLVATNAFGMGVDNAHIRAIVHYQMPSTLEAYYQEAGRAGRDGEPAHCLFLYNYADRRVPDFFIECAHPDRELVEDTWSFVCDWDDPVVDFDARQLARDLPGRVLDGAVSAALVLLDKAGHLRLEGSSSAGRLRRLDPPEVELRIDWVKHEERRAHEESKLNEVIFYATAKRCRTRSILRYFGSKVPFEDRCGHCDLCVEVAPYASGAAAPRKRKSRRRRSGSPARVGVLRVPESPSVVCRKVAAAVARCRQAESRHIVARVLVGSPLAEIRARGLDGLSTFGLLPTMRAGQVESVIDLMVGAGLLVDNGEHVGLTEAGLAVMKGAAEVPASLSSALAPNQAAPKGAPGVEKGSEGLDTVAQTVFHAEKGLDCRQIAKVRGIQAKTVAKHLITAADRGDAAAIDLQRFVDPTVVAAIRTVCEVYDWRQGLVEMRSRLRAEMDRQVPYQEIRLAVAYLLQQGELGAST